MLSQLFTGGLLSGAVFMANDYATSPITKRGQYIYSVIIGLLIACFRVLGSSAEGVSYASITSNLLVPLIEKITVYDDKLIFEFKSGMTIELKR